MQTIINEHTGKEFELRVILKGDRYGRNLCLTHHNAEPMVEFHDGAVFVARYYLTEIARSAERGDGIHLQCDAPNWWITGKNAEQTLKYLRHVCSGGNR